MDDVEAAFAAAIMRTAESVIPLQERRRLGRGWSGDARTEAELLAATDAMHTERQRLKMNTRDAQLRRVIKRSCNWLKRVRNPAVVRFFKRHVVKGRSSCAREISTDTSKTSNRCSWRRQRRSSHSASATRKGDCCATKGVSARGG